MFKQAGLKKRNKGDQKILSEGFIAYRTYGKTNEMYNNIKVYYTFILQMVSANQIIKKIYMLNRVPRASDNIALNYDLKIAAMARRVSLSKFRKITRG